jgi:arylsulfatase A-like enzyme/predicted negative regulator of RcsB-dependent stress response
MRHAKLLLYPSVTIIMALVLLAGCGRQPKARSLLLISVDTTRADRIGAYGHEAAQTPTIDRLAAEGTLFERAYSTVPETLPSHTSMMTGLYPPSHAVRLNLMFRVPPDLRTLAEILRADGFYTAAVTSAPVLDGRYGLNQGFISYVDPQTVGGGRTQLKEIRAQMVTNRALAALNVAGDRRFFLWAHYYDPHSPFDPPPPFKPDEEEQIPPESLELYDREISYADLWIGKLLEGVEERGLLDDTLIILIGDHGESLGDHGETYHTVFIYDSTQQVPLIVKGPGVEAGKRVDAVVSALDIFATALEFLGLEPPESSSRVLPGLPVSPDKETGERVAYSDSMTPPLRYGWNALESLRTRDWLYVRAPDEELYRLDGSDPNQEINLAYTDRRQLAAMRELLEQTVEDMPDLGLEEAAGHTPSEEQREALAALGYLSTSGGGERPVGEGVDAKDMIEVAEAFQMANLAENLEEIETAEELLSWVVEADPDNYGGWIKLGQVYYKQDKFEEAVATLNRALEIRPSSWEALAELAAAEQEVGHFSEAETHFQQALESSPFPAEVWRKLARLRLEKEDWEGAANSFRKVLELQPADPRAQAALRQLAASGRIEPPEGASPGAQADRPDTP